MDPYKELMNAVVLQAADDYRRALKTLKEDPDDRDAALMKEEVEQFFRSQWFTALAGIDGDWLIQKLTKEIEQ